jgi:hypothetical protein
MEIVAGTGDAVQRNVAVVCIGLEHPVFGPYGMVLLQHVRPFLAYVAQKPSIIQTLVLRMPPRIAR